MPHERKWWWQAFAEPHQPQPYQDPMYWLVKMTEFIHCATDRVAGNFSEEAALSILKASITQDWETARPYVEEILNRIPSDSAKEELVRFLIDAEIRRPDEDVQLKYLPYLNSTERADYAQAVYEGRFSQAYAIARLDRPTRIRVLCELFLESALKQE
jgi:hypothetical protein